MAKDSISGTTSVYTFLDEVEDSYEGNTQNPSSLNPYNYAYQNPLKYMDPSGHILVRVLSKLGIGALFDMGMQLVANYFFNPKTEGNFKASFNKISWHQVFVSGVENIFDVKNKALAAAITDLGDVVVNWMKQGKKYNCEKALKDFAMGFLSDIAARYVCKFGAKVVAKGMEKMGVNPAKIKKLTGIDISDNKNAKSAPKTTKAGRNKSGTTTKPNQVHHYATNKSKTYTPQLEEIANRYGLDLDDVWNKDLLPHQGRHPNAYHEYVLDSMKQFDNIAQGDTKIYSLSYLII